MKRTVNRFDLREFPPKITRFNRAGEVRADTVDLIESFVPSLHVERAKPRRKTLVADDVKQRPGGQTPALVVAAVVVRISEDDSECGKISSHRFLERFTTRQAVRGTTTLRAAVLEDIFPSALCRERVIVHVISASNARQDDDDDGQKSSAHDYI